MTSDIRSEFADALERGDIQQAIQRARELLRGDDGIRQWSHVRNTFERFPQGVDDLIPVRVALLASFSIEFIHDPLIAAGYLEGLRLEIYQAGFNQFRQELFDPSSALGSFKPDITFLAAEGVQLAPVLYDRFLDVDSGATDRAVTQAKSDIEALVKSHAALGAGLLVMHDFIPPAYRSLGILDGQAERGQIDLVEELNQWLRELARAHQNLYVLAYHELVTQIGRDSWEDSRMRHYAQAPIAQRHMPALAREYIKYVRAQSGRTRKGLILDLDNTLWGGVLGEEGQAGIKLGPDYPGSAYLEFQQAIKELSRRGILLAIASKNNREEVIELFRQHPHMVLREEDFAAMEIHWEPKSGSIRRIADLVNLGLGHLVFVDDSPAECEEVRLAMPEVTVLVLPSRPEDFVAAILSDGLFDGLSFSTEDRKRTQLYQQRAQAEQLRAASGSLDKYYESLEMSVSIDPVDTETVPRAAQLTQKTNQFNLTTIRHDEETVRKRATDLEWITVTVSVEDRFGDNGIVGLIMARKDDGALEIETFLLSCRVIGRTIETAMLAWLVDQCRSGGIDEIRGVVIPTPRNEPARDLYERHGFEQVKGDTGNETRWRLIPVERPIDTPGWLNVRTAPATPQD